MLFLLAGTLLCAQTGRPEFKGPFIVRGILVDGNRHTKERIILRELTFHEGDTLGTDALYEQLRRSKENLQNLGLFNTVDMLPSFLGRGEVFVAITVTERWYWWPQPRMQFADPNFNIWWLTKDPHRINYGLDLYRYNLRGRNETVMARCQLGYSKDFGLMYRVPNFDRSQRWGMEVSGGFGEQDEITIGTEDNKRVLLKTPAQNIYERWNVALKATFRPGLDVRHTMGINWYNVAVKDTVIRRSPGYLGYGAGRTEYMGFNYRLTVDHRDSRSYPLQGMYFQLKLEHAGIGAGQPQVTSLMSKVQRSWKRSDRWSFGGSLGGKASFGTADHYFLQEGLGYNEYLRGYEYYTMDGQYYVLGKANVLFTLMKPVVFRVEPIPMESFRTHSLALYLNAFCDQGQVWDLRPGIQDPLSNHWQYAFGLGLDVVASYDMVMRLEYAVNRLSETGLYLHFTQPF